MIACGGYDPHGISARFAFIRSNFYSVAPSRLLKHGFNSLRPHSCLSRGGREGSQFLRRVLRTKAKSLRFFEGSQHPAKQRSAGGGMRTFGILIVALFSMCAILVVAKPGRARLPSSFQLEVGAGPNPTFPPQWLRFGSTRTSSTPSVPSISTTATAVRSLN